MTDRLVLKSNVMIAPFDDGLKTPSYIVTMSDRNWKISQLAFYILSELQHQDSGEAVKNSIQEKYDIQVHKREIETVLDFVTKNGLASGTEDLKKAPHTNRYLWGRVTIFPAKFVSRVRLFTVFFKKGILIPVMILNCIWLGNILIKNNSISVATRFYEMDLIHVIFSYLVVILLGLIHEFGHASALMHYGGAPGRIGAGIYFIMPVFFSDVTRTWKLKRYERIVVDAGGLYLQLFAMMCLYFFNNMALHSTVVEMGILLSSLEILHNLNPFIRLDGYWMLCDYLGVTNLITVARKLIMQPFMKAEKRDPDIVEIPNFRKAVLYVYLVCTMAFFVYFGNVLITSIGLAVSTFGSDISYVLGGRLSADMITVKNAAEYISSRFSSLIVMIFMIRIATGLLKKAVVLIAQLAKGKKADADTGI